MPLTLSFQNLAQGNFFIEAFLDTLYYSGINVISLLWALLNPIIILSKHPQPFVTFIYLQVYLPLQNSDFLEGRNYYIFLFIPECQEQWKPDIISEWIKEWIMKDYNQLSDVIHLGF